MQLLARLNAVRKNPAKLRKLLTPITGYDETQKWSRVVMQRECDRLIEVLQPERLKVLEISGNVYQKFAFKEYTSLSFPDYDICSTVLAERFDLIIAEQVFEHLLWPYRAGRNVYEMLNPGGHFLISTPFLVKIHNYPIDCSRWTEIGLKHFLAECGFLLDNIQTASWGNRKCVAANFGKRWVRYHRRLHSLKNEPDFPYSVWALARK
jgi:SAM-dependent methyltransferase